MKKNVIKILFCSMFCVLALLFPACKSSSDEETDSTPSENDPSVTEPFFIKNDSLEMLLAEEVYLDVIYTQEAEKELVFDSSDTNVVSVDAYGKCTALTCGDAEITVSYGEKTAKASVTVGLGGKKPELVLKNVSDEILQISLGEPFDLDGVVLFNEKEYQADTIECVLENEIATISKSVITPVQTGKSRLTIKAVWHGVETVSLTRTITLKIIDNVLLYVNDGLEELVLYTKSQIKGEYFATQSAFVVYGCFNGQSIQPTATILEGEEYIVYDKEAEMIYTNGQRGVVKIQLSYIDAFNVEHKQYVTVRILQSVISSETGDRMDSFNPDWLDDLAFKPTSTNGDFVVAFPPNWLDE